MLDGSPRLLSSLPADHPDRSRLLEGAWKRSSIPLPIDVVDDEVKRGLIRDRRAAGERQWTPWKRVAGWPVGKVSYNQLGSVWVEDSEWTFDYPVARKAAAKS